ncbi:D-Ala-D-Ala carboxypeptidase family metallohydrolase [Eubacterium sp.]|uniref:YcbK family protein n=1 Tax=Eubacterium sp. TaxID=142586 RepID=UPI0026DF2854|nr:D-Ala-D-Ala carboxypeptidase family metallohydrolase [Eubacterium sp.]MDO5434545.1 D-Ala-D-Ala carboxypeptidase family metallohydrolase [Eubacterium sp.]
MKRFKIIFTGLLAASCVAVSVIFACGDAGAPPQADPPAAEAAPAPSAEAPQEPPAPEETTEPMAAAPEPVMASPHFAMEEYRCDCAGHCDGWPAAIDPELLAMIEELRCACESPVVITSGVRCEARNAEVGGVAWSFHKRGHAADLYCPGMPVGQLAALAQDVGLNILPYYSSGYIHVEN